MAPVTNTTLGAITTTFNYVIMYFSACRMVQRSPVTFMPHLQFELVLQDQETMWNRKI